MATEQRLIELIECLERCADNTDCERCSRWLHPYDEKCVDDLLATAAKELKKFVDARPVVHGEWIPTSNKPGVNAGKKCSLCGARITNREHYNGNHLFCHKCGNPMDGGADNG